MQPLLSLPTGTKPPVTDLGIAVIYNVPSGEFNFQSGNRLDSKGSEGTCFYKAMYRIFFKNVVHNSVYSNEINKNSGFLESLFKTDLKTYSVCLDKLIKDVSLLEEEHNRRLFTQGSVDYKQTNKEAAQFLLEIHNEIDKGETIHKLESIKMNKQSFQNYYPQEQLIAFISSGKNNFFEFLCQKYFENKKVIYLNFFSETCQQNDNLIQILSSASNNPINEQVSQLQHIIQSLSATMFGFKTSSWNETKTIVDLLDELRIHGPVIISGKFGKSYYNIQPQELNEKISDKQVFGWKNAERAEISRSHIVTIIGVIKDGAKDKGGGFVYIMDPNDPSDPLNTSADKIYKISYKTLIGYIDNFPLMGGCAIYPSGNFPVKNFQVIENPTNEHYFEDNFNQNIKLS